MISKLTTIPITILLVATAFGAEVRITIHPATQGYKYLDPPGVDHPVITTASHNSKQMVESLEITNYSSKVITEVTYGWRIASAAKCTGHKFPAKWGKKTEKVNIAPGSAATLAAPPMLTTNEYLHQIIDEADTTGAHSIVVTIGVLKVTYADGTEWEDKDAGSKNMFDGGIAETIEGCGPTTTTTSDAKPRPRCQNVNYKLKDVIFSNPLDQCWPTPARACTGRVILAGDCPFEDCVIVGCGYDCSLTWTVCWGSFYPLACNPVGGG